VRPLQAGSNLREQLKPLASQRGFVEREAGDVPARLVEPLDEAAGDGLGHVRKDDWDRPRLPLEGSGCRSPGCQNDVGLQADTTCGWTFGTAALTPIGYERSRRSCFSSVHDSCRLREIINESPTGPCAYRSAIAKSTAGL
jgi:hypothetical protein